MSKRRESHCLLSRDLTCADSCFDSWINSPASTIKRAVFLFSSSTLRRNKADSSSCCDLADNPRAVEQHRLASDANHQIAQETDAQRHDGGGMCKRLLAGCGKSLNRDDSPPQGLKPSLILPDLRGAKAPLYHSAAGFRDFFRSLLGLYAVCSAHPQVIAASAREAHENGSVLHVESTSSQVNQFGGYTGQNPEQFAGFVRSVAWDARLSDDQVLLGGDHLGPFPWRSESASVAMDKACALVRACVLAGYQKIHLDASMACADDPKPGLDERAVADRAAVLCETAENAFRELAPNSPPLLYVVGTEVPAPGGESVSEESISVTAAGRVQCTLDAFKRAFDKHRLEDAWERVIGLVVQPGVEFGESNVFDYDRRKTKALSVALPASPQLVYEAHSTDYPPA